MRQRVVALAVALVTLGPGLARARADIKPKPIDASHMRDKLDVYRDDAGHYVVVLREPGDDSAAWVFYGDAKALYQQRVFGLSSGGDGQDFTMWSPRLSDQTGAQILLPASGAATKPRISCGQSAKADRPLQQLPADQARTMLARATFYPPLWQRSAHLLARSDDGIYYYVDVIRDELGGGGPRLFVGKKQGQMKEVALTAVVSDPAGEVYTTADGALKTFGQADKPPVWRKGDKVTELTALDLTDMGTRLIIYRDFAIYGALGTPCD